MVCNGGKIYVCVSKHQITRSLWHTTGTVEFWLSLDTHSVTQYRETRHLVILKTSGQMLSDLSVIKPDNARVHTTIYVKC